VVVSRPDIQYLNYKDCLIDSDTALQFSAKQSNGDDLPDFMSLNSLTGELKIDSTSNLTMGVYSLVVTATESDGFGCFSIEKHSQISINYAVKLIYPPSNQIAYSGLPFAFPINITKYF